MPRVSSYENIRRRADRNFREGYIPWIWPIEGLEWSRRYVQTIEADMLDKCANVSRIEMEDRP